MLVLTRRQGERIVLNPGEKQIVIETVEIQGNRVRLGVKCDRTIVVYREEVYNRIQEERKGGKSHYATGVQTESEPKELDPDLAV